MTCAPFSLLASHVFSFSSPDRPFQRFYAYSLGSTVAQGVLQWQGGINPDDAVAYGAAIQGV